MLINARADVCGVFRSVIFVGQLGNSIYLCIKVKVAGETVRFFFSFFIVELRKKEGKV
jgi:hypothetical protein